MQMGQCLHERRRKMEKQSGKIWKNLAVIVFVISLPFAVLLQVSSEFGNAGIVINLILGFGLGIFLAAKITGALTDQQGKWKVAAAFLAALYTSYNYTMQGNGVYLLSQHLDIVEKLSPVRVTSNRLVAGFVVASFPAIFFLIYYVIAQILPYVRKFLGTLDRTERRFLVAFSVVGIVMMGFLYVHTNAFYDAVHNGKTEVYDVIYTTDSTMIYTSDSFMRILSGENDIRQPLFGLFSMPVALLAKLVSLPFFFLHDSYAYALQAIQIVLLGIAHVMLARLLELGKKEKYAFWAFFVGSYTYVLFSFVVEQYIMAYFYVVLTIYVWKNSEKKNYAYFGAVSTMLTSGVLFPMITKKKKWKEWITDLLYCLVVYFELVILCGQLPQFLNIRNKLADLMFFAGGKVTLQQKWIQFTWFVEHLFLAPSAADAYAVDRGAPRFLLAEQQSVSVIGIVILIAAVLGFLYSYKNKMSQIAVCWVGFSVVLLFLVGWGTAENGLILYSMYFAWAYLILIYQFICKWIRNEKAVLAVIGVFAGLMLLYNLGGLYQIYQFGVINYPVG